MVWTLGIILPVTLGFSLATRKAVPVSSEIPAALRGQERNFEATAMVYPQLFPKLRLTARVWRERHDAGIHAVEFAPAGNVLMPDLLVYWAPGGTMIAGALPTNAVEIGAFGPGPLPWPTEFTNFPGVFVLYSLANHQIVDVSAPIQLDPPHP
jgi:hypothetical protein